MTATNRAVSIKDRAYQAFWALRLGFGILPILFGIDKFTTLLTADWTRYLADSFDTLAPGDANTAMQIIGVIEIVAGIAVLLLPRLGARSSRSGWARSSSTC